MNLLSKILMVFCSMQSITVMAATIQEQTWTQKVFKPLIELQCANELKSSKIWQASSFFFSAEQQQKAQQNICGCVSDNALNDVCELWLQGSCFSVLPFYEFVLRLDL